MSRSSSKSKSFIFCHFFANSGPVRQIGVAFRFRISSLNWTRRARRPVCCATGNISGQPDAERFQRQHYHRGAVHDWKNMRMEGWTHKRVWPAVTHT